MSIFSLYLDQLLQVPGVVAASCIQQGRKITLPSRTTLHTPSQLEAAWLAVADTYNLLRLHRLPTRDLKWQFGTTSLCSLEIEGLIVAFFTHSENSDLLCAQIKEKTADFLAKMKEAAR